MRLQPCLLPLLVGVLLTVPGCTRLRVESQKRATLVALLDEWKGKPLQEFLRATGWRPTGELGRKDSLTREVVFDALGAQSGGGAGGALSYHQATTWTNNIPSAGSAGGANQPLGVPPPHSTVHTERVMIPGHGSPSRLGCQLTLHVAADGKIQAWDLKGSECFVERLDRLKRS